MSAPSSAAAQPSPPDLTGSAGAGARAEIAELLVRLRWLRHVLPTNRAVRVLTHATNFAERQLGVSPEALLNAAYALMLGRTPDPSARANVLPAIQNGDMDALELVHFILASEEFRCFRPCRTVGTALHASRSQFVRSLPAAKRILDLGGSDSNPDGSPAGALLGLGYPYPFDELVIVDLPMEDRHELYSAHASVRDTIDTPLGPVSYDYRSMVDLSPYADGTFDLVYSGQSIEHVTEDEGDKVLAETFRVLKPGGCLALDTPNRAITALASQTEYSNPDHKIEYTHASLVAKLGSAGFSIVRSTGLNYAGESAAMGTYDEAAVAANIGTFDEIERCYLLAYVCERP